ncbi:hypothetical protein AD006_25285 [Pseudonocardia sp. EC080610-09]|uniref:hypothetical protein n=1 Tax=unclassified Pseudonocardia TaxID=2619320 RepID=UPI0006CB7EF5|nr:MULTISPECIES: hypothetical protein [unclassified Pseudonocardia]ALE74381.1 hypothetical protein FRP1_17840 [Pseudonocardia sp. EC080625-04]ALL77793.1 hypothetical protein AD006_25285 [Pseudonocardia sp. EC080610-09]ALL80708.1 hypothetical protein AD017_04875 [Pseudonocardia sp. EC080619-01]
MSIVGEPTPRERLAHRVRSQIRRLAVDGFGAHETTAPIGDSGFTRPGLDDPMAGLRAAVLTRNVAEATIHDSAVDVRAAGRTWDEVAEALGIEDDDRFAPRGERAFEEVVGLPDLFALASVRWTCTTCGRRVSESGPYESHPDDNEHGHDEVCDRRVRAVAAWRVRAGEGR